MDKRAITAKEKEFLHPRAALSKDHQRLSPRKEDYRLPYKRDVDAIIHSKAYSRYVDKTQVVYLVDNDHITHRSLHVQLVSHFARGIAEILRLNVDLVEAISLGHDVGHPPFGHEGEDYLSKLSQENGEKEFAHPWHSCRLFREIEPLNLGLDVYDGFLCHDGGMESACHRPHFGKTWEDHFSELEQKLENAEANFAPATLEGCLVKLCDTMSYVGRDIEDAIRLGIVKRKEIPKTPLGNSNKKILDALAEDIIQNSRDQDTIAISKEAFEALKILRSFNFQTIYVHPALKAESEKIEKSYRFLFEWLLKDFQDHPDSSYLWTHFLHNKSEKYLSETSPVRKVIDYIAGMTDRYFVKTIQKLIVPKEIELI